MIHKTYGSYRIVPYIRYKDIIVFLNKIKKGFAVVPTLLFNLVDLYQHEIHKCYKNLKKRERERRLSFYSFSLTVPI
jgi:endonuclease YncB( thermonuclease family)